MIEPRKGLVLYLDPDVLVREGARCVDPDRRRWVRGAHFFLCSDVDREAGESLWWPLYSRPSDHRVALAGLRFGHDGWTAGTNYWSPRQAWWATPAAIDAAAYDDLSRDGSRNIVVEFDAPSRRLLEDEEHGVQP